MSNRLARLEALEAARPEASALPPVLFRVISGRRDGGPRPDSDVVGVRVRGTYIARAPGEKIPALLARAAEMAPAEPESGLVAMPVFARETA